MITEKQIEFCKQISLAKNASEAYRIAFKSKSQATCKVNGSKLLRSRAIQLKIKEFQDENKKMNAAANTIAAKSIAENEIATKVERQKLLTDIIRGAVKFKKPFVISGKITEYPVEPDIVKRLKAIAELNKMEGDYVPKTQAINLTLNKPEGLNHLSDAELEELIKIRDSEGK